jgi:transcription termination factor Rho
MNQHNRSQGRNKPVHSRTTGPRHPRRTDQRDPRRTDQRDPRRTDQRDPRRTDQRDPRRTDQRDPRRTDQHDPRRTDHGHPRRTDQRDPRRTDQHDPRRTDHGHPRRTDQGQPRGADQGPRRNSNQHHSGQRNEHPRGVQQRSPGDRPHRPHTRPTHQPHRRPPSHIHQPGPASTPGPEQESTGVLELIQSGAGFLRQINEDLQPSQGDVFVPPSLIQQKRLEQGMLLKVMAAFSPSRGQSAAVTKLLEINGQPADDYHESTPFERQVSIDPQERFVLTPAKNPQTDRSLRLLELMTPIGKGQRALIVAPPRTGKTTLLHDLATSIEEHHPETFLVVLLVDERPEEVTHFKRSVKGAVIASSSDQDAVTHLRVARLTLDLARSQAESGRDVFLLLDSITRLGRASNRQESNRGKTLSGGVGSRALEFPRRFFGSARNLEGGGSLTIVATALIDTGSRMDEVIFQEFKGTGNMELVLDRKLADSRLFPAVDLSQSGTRKEEKILPPEWLNASHKLRRHLSNLPPKDALDVLMERLSKAESVQAFCETIL